MTLFKHWQRMWLALPQAQHRKGSVSVESQRPCPRCDPTARAIEYVRVQWIAAGIDRE